ncbi:MAG: metallophosphoesterase [Bacteroidota bacterium]
MGKRWVIPDIHGCINTLQILIDEQIKPARYDELYFLGDYLDRGPDPKGVIDFIRKLQKDEYSITALRGNHEDFVIELYDAECQAKIPWLYNFANKKKKLWYDIGGVETLESFEIRNLKEMPVEYIEWLRDLPYYKILDDFILVHAGLNFSAQDPFKDTRSMMWTREFKVDTEKIGNKRIIHGHVPINLELIDLSVRNSYYKVIDLDNGPYIEDSIGLGNLVALELNSMKMVIQDNRDWE